jgi:hypothetical protein
MPQKISKEVQEINYHAARLLILIANCGRPASASEIKGRTLLAKLDFFLRYPAYLNKAALIQKNKGLEELMDYEINNVETRMVRYKYGPWDNIYYSVLAYLLAKDLIQINVRSNVEYFGLTDRGRELVEELSQSNNFQKLVLRAQILKKLFPNWSGSRVKQFIYTNFPEVVSLPIGKEI